MVCRLFAEGAVRLPSGRFTPYAAQSRFESACGDNFPVLNSLPLWRALRACISGMPPVLFGLGSGMVAGVSAQAALASRTRTMAFFILRIPSSEFYTLPPGVAPSQPPSANQPHQPVTHQADPEIYGQSPIDLVKLVLRARREEPLHAEVNGIPRQHGDQGLPEPALPQPFHGRSPGLPVRTNPALSFGHPSRKFSILPITSAGLFVLCTELDPAGSHQDPSLTLPHREAKRTPRG